MRAEYLSLRVLAVPILGIVAIAAGLLFPLPALGGVSRHQFWLGALMILGAPVVWGTISGMLRGRFAADVVATMAIVGAALLGDPLPGLIVVIMQTGGEALDAYAMARASDAVAALEADAPRVAHRLVGDNIEDIDPDHAAIGDLLLVRPGELVPVDGVVTDGSSDVDTSRLTGEPVPVNAGPGTSLSSGSINGTGALVMSVSRVARESQYARIVALVRDAQASKSPLQRTADRWAIWFTPLTLIICLAAWLPQHDWHRVLAVLVVATPCPLILAAPVAVIGGISRAARSSIIVRNGDALEALTQLDTAVFDKTGTLTVGRPAMAGIITSPVGHDDFLLGAAAAVERSSGHLLGRVVVEAAEQKQLGNELATDVEESPGRGVQGTVADWQVAVGSDGFVLEIFPDAGDALQPLVDGAPSLAAFVAASPPAGSKHGVVCGRIDFADLNRPDLPELFRDLDEIGIRRRLMLSGDRQANVAAVAEALGIKEHHGDLSAADKVAEIRKLVAAGKRVVMIGDGTNDAPALGAATVGVALAGHGGGVTAEAADVVLLVDQPRLVVDAIRIARRAMHIARQSMGVGLSLSLVGMIAAALGYLPPTAGALAQEAIDVAVILNALRSGRPGSTPAAAS
jgi:heavy metal translocating P-type ATPase